MKIVLFLMLTSIAMMFNPDKSTECSIDQFLGEWSGATICDGEEGPTSSYHFVKGEEPNTIIHNGKDGKPLVLTVDGCTAKGAVDNVEEGIENVKFTFTVEDGNLAMENTFDIVSPEKRMSLGCTSKLMKK